MAASLLGTWYLVLGIWYLAFLYAANSLALATKIPAVRRSAKYQILSTKDRIPEIEKIPSAYVPILVRTISNRGESLQLAFR
jgi:hypothetical protein